MDDWDSICCVHLLLEACFFRSSSEKFVKNERAISVLGFCLFSLLNNHYLTLHWKMARHSMPAKKLYQIGLSVAQRTSTHARLPIWEKIVIWTKLVESLTTLAKRCDHVISQRNRVSIFIFSPFFLISIRWEKMGRIANGGIVPAWYLFPLYLDLYYRGCMCVRLEKYIESF